MDDDDGVDDGGAEREDDDVPEEGSHQNTLFIVSVVLEPCRGAGGFLVLSTAGCKVGVLRLCHVTAVLTDSTKVPKYPA